LRRQVGEREITTPSRRSFLERERERERDEVRKEQWRRRKEGGRGEGGSSRDGFKGFWREKR